MEEGDLTLGPRPPGRGDGLPKPAGKATLHSKYLQNTTHGLYFFVLGVANSTNMK